MKILMLAALVLAAGVAEAKDAQCSLTTAKIDVFQGQCDFSPDPDGSFMITHPEGYFVYVSVTDKGVADGYWNGWDRDSHAHTGLGTLLREEEDRACWSNGYARVCAR